VGSTIDMVSRKYRHKQACNNEKNNLKLYKTMRDNGGWDAFNFVIICNYQCNTRQEALKEEDRIMRLMKANMNSIHAYDVNRIHTEEKSARHAIERAERIAKHKIEMVELKAKEDVKKLKRKTARERRANAVHKRGYWEELEYQQSKTVSIL
tara:strand:- start:210 stop:665 length:456 start_codon:yes stop_codon:yes gene_type:complete